MRRINVGVLSIENEIVTFVGATEELVKRQLAFWCRRYWKDQDFPIFIGYDMDNDEDVLEVFFDQLQGFAYFVMQTPAFATMNNINEVPI